MRPNIDSDDLASDHLRQWPGILKRCELIPVLRKAVRGRTMYPHVIRVRRFRWPSIEPAVDFLPDVPASRSGDGLRDGGASRRRLQRPRQIPMTGPGLDGVRPERGGLAIILDVILERLGSSPGIRAPTLSSLSLGTGGASRQRIWGSIVARGITWLM
jgi:hypothetical protein